MEGPGGLGGEPREAPGLGEGSRGRPFLEGGGGLLPARAAQGCTVGPRRSAAWGRVWARHGAAQGRGAGLRRGAAWGCAGAQRGAAHGRGMRPCRGGVAWG